MTTLATASLATDHIAEIFRTYQIVQQMEDPPPEMLDLMEEAQAIIANEAAIDLSFLTASEKQSMLADDFWQERADVIAWVGANRCLGPETPINGSPVSDGSDHTVAYFNEEGVMCAKVVRPFRKPEGPIFRVYLSTGEWLDVGDGHLFLTACGWADVRSLLADVPCLRGSTADSPDAPDTPQSRAAEEAEIADPEEGAAGIDATEAEVETRVAPRPSDTCPSEFERDGPRWKRTTRDYLCGCSVCSRLRDAQPLVLSGGVRDAFPSSIDEVVRIHLGSLLDESASIRVRSLTCRKSRLLSMQDVQHRIEALSSGSGSRACDTASTPSGVYTSDASPQFPESRDQPRSTFGSSPPATIVRHLSQALLVPYQGGSEYASIVAYEPRGVQPIWDISLPAPHAYVLGGVISHNSGKSWGAGRLCSARWVRDKGYPGARVWCISQTFKLSIAGPQRELWEALPQDNFSKQWNDEVGFGDNGTVRYRVAGPDGKKNKWMVIQFFNEEQNPNVFETVPVDLVWWDEAQKEALFGRLLMRLLDRNGRILISTLPQEVWLRMRIEESGNPRYRHVSFTTFDNEKNLPEGKIKQLADGLSPEEYRMRILGEYVTLTGLCFPEFINLLRPEGHVSETPSELPEDCNCCLFIDPGVHTAALLMVVDANGDKYVWDEVYEQGMRVDAICDKIKEMLKLWQVKVEDIIDIAMDPAGWALTPSNEMTLADEYAEEGINCRRWIRTRDFPNGGERAMINIVRKDFVNNCLFINDRCTRTIAELRTWRWVMDEQQKIDIRERTGRTANHSCDCIKAWIAERPTFGHFAAGVFDTADDLEPTDEDEDQWQENLV